MFLHVTGVIKRPYILKTTPKHEFPGSIEQAILDRICPSTPGAKLTWGGGCGTSRTIVAQCEYLKTTMSKTFQTHIQALKWLAEMNARNSKPTDKADPVSDLRIF